MAEALDGELNLTRKGLAEVAGSNIETIRYYEHKGLLPTPRRAANGYRLYERPDIRRLSLIMRLRGLGFPLVEVRQFLALVDGGTYSCGEIHQIASDQIARIAGRMKDLAKIRRRLTTMAEACGRGDVPDCPIIDDLFSDL